MQPSSMSIPPSPQFTGAPVDQRMQKFKFTIHTLVLKAKNIIPSKWNLQPTEDQITHQLYSHRLHRLQCTTQAIHSLRTYSFTRPSQLRGQSQRLPGSYYIIGIHIRKIAREITLTGVMWPNYTCHLIESHIHSARARNRNTGKNEICHACQVNETIFYWVGEYPFFRWEIGEEVLTRYSLYLRTRRPIMSTIAKSWMAPTPCTLSTPS